MTLGGVLVVRNEQPLIQRCIRWHLELSGLDHLIVVNNGSTDGTVAAVRELNDPRVVLRHTAPDAGFVQDSATVQGFRELVDRFGCDWVLPIDADELWLSLEHESPREVLTALPGEPWQVLSSSLLFVESVLDDPAEEDPMRRLRYAGLEKMKKILLHRRGVAELESLVIGNHRGSFRSPAEPYTVELAPELLARMHFRFMGTDNYARRVLNQAEGFMMRLGERWLRGDRSLGGEHVHYMYQLLKRGQFRQEYRKRFVLDEPTLRERLASGSLRRIDRVAELLDEHAL